MPLVLPLALYLDNYTEPRHSRKLLLSISGCLRNDKSVILVARHTRVAGEIDSRTRKGLYKAPVASYLPLLSFFL